VSAGPTLVIVSGLSGAGRTTVMKALEDLGFYCVDNVPIALLEPFVDLFGERADRLAAVVDVRERDFLSDFPDTHARLQRRGLLSELLFLDASDEILARRFGETRRSHPVAPSVSLPDAIAQERLLLAPVSERADAVVDTSDMSVHELKRFVTRRYTGSSTGGRMEIELVSFGFRHGAPEQADLVLDVRFLPNPYYEPGLRERTGEAEEVAAYVLGSPRSRAFLDRLLDFLEFLIPLYEEEGKAYLAIAIGCTGGLHRSVAIVNVLEGSLRDRKIEARVRHRDLDRARRAHV
jgi:UPF0042 nucleotide-binding protein